MFYVTESFVPQAKEPNKVGIIICPHFTDEAIQP